MTNPNLTALLFVMDASGSMSSVREETRTGFNKFIEEQKQVPGEAQVTFVTFDSHVNRVYENVPLNDVQALQPNDYVTGGYTALYDAVGSTIDKAGTYFASLPEDQRPNRVLLVVATDGEENASKEYDNAAVRAKIAHQREVYGWEIIFTAADIDERKAAQSMGISKAMKFDKTTRGMNNFYGTLSAQSTNYRTSGNFDAPAVDNTTPVNTPPTVTP